MPKREYTYAVDVRPEPPVRNGRSSIPPRRLPSDDFVVVVDGTEYHPHAGEYLEVSATRTLRETRTLDEQSRPLDAEDAVAYFDRLWRLMTAGYLLGWTWTRDGAPLPAVDEPEAWLDLTDDEQLYVIQKVIGGWRESRPLPSTPPG